MSCTLTRLMKCSREEVQRTGIPRKCIPVFPVSETRKVRPLQPSIVYAFCHEFMSLSLEPEGYCSNSNKPEDIAQKRILFFQIMENVRNSIPQATQLTYRAHRGR
ncbi:hypothetical protein ABZP36_028828 [Zizania latifolia]